MKSIFNKGMALLLVMLMSMGVIAPAVAEGEDTIKLAVIAPLTGDFAQYGEAYRLHHAAAACCTTTLFRPPCLAA